MGLVVCLSYDMVKVPPAVSYLPEPDKKPSDYRMRMQDTYPIRDFMTG